MEIDSEPDLSFCFICSEQGSLTNHMYRYHNNQYLLDDMSFATTNEF